MSHYVKIKRGTTPNIGLARLRSEHPECLLGLVVHIATAVVTEEGKKQAH